jgi:EAL domain-containing protein (putative c-di-GMP-specific phosphodiesterase class I)
VERAIRRRAFRLVYQPIVHLDSGDLSGVEALCRCDDETSPDVWFAACERLGLAAAMDVAILELALDELDALPTGYVAINLSAATLADAPVALLSLVGEAADRRQIVLELTEHAEVTDYPATTAALAALREAGVLFAVDDAGAGHSSFRHIVRLGPDIIKLDRSITERIDGDATRKALVGALVIFAGEVGAVVVAEGIETRGELAAVRAAGVSRGQGFGLAPPQPLPLAPVIYEPVPFVDLVAEAGPFEEPDPEGDPMRAAHRMRAALAAMNKGVGLLRRSDGELDIEEFRAICSALARQLDGLSGNLDHLVEQLLSTSLD